MNTKVSNVWTKDKEFKTEVENDEKKWTERTKAKR